MPILRRTRTRNPDSAIPVNLQNPLAKGMYIDIDPRYGFREGIYGLDADIIAGASVVYRENGREFDFSGSSTGILWNANPLYQNTGDMTILVEANLDSITADSPFHSLGIGGESSATNFISFFTLTSAYKPQLFWEYGSGSNVSLVATNAVAASNGETHQYALTRKVGSTSSGAFYFDGEVHQTYSGLTNPSGGSSSQMIIGSNFYSSGSFQTDTNGRVKVRCFNRVLEDEEIRAYFDNWWQVLEPKKIYIPGSIGITINATSDSLVITENAVTVNAEISLTATKQSLAITEYPVTVSLNINIAATVDTLAITNYATSINAETNINAGFDALAITSYSVSINAENNISANTDSLILTTYAATVDLTTDTNVNAGFDALVISTYSATVNAEINVSSGFKALAITTYAANIELSSGIAVGTQALTITPNQVSINAENNVAVSSVALSLTTYSANVSLGINITASLDTLALTTYLAGINAETNIQVTTDSLIITPKQATITAISNAVHTEGLEYTMDGEKLHYTIVGQKLHYIMIGGKLHYTLRS